MKLTKALKLKNKLAGDVEKLKDLLKKQNVRSKRQEFDYDNRELLAKLRAKIDELVAVKTAIAQANATIYNRIFRAAELKGMVATLNSLDTRSGVHLETGIYVERPIEVEYVAQLGKVEIDRLVAELVVEIESVQDELDEFNHANEVTVTA
jgi:hypothetical protein